MNKGQGPKSDDRVPFSLFHAAVDREKEVKGKQAEKESDKQKELNDRE